MNITLKDINTTFGTSYTLDSLKNMSAVDQLSVVKLQFEMWQNRGKSLTDVSDFYMTVFSPKYAGKPNSTEMYKYSSLEVPDTTISISGDTTIIQKQVPNKKSAYWQNRGLDSNNDSVITKGEAAAKVRAKLSRGTKFYK